MKPEDVHAPKKHWSLIAVLEDNVKDERSGHTCALAVGRWDTQPVLGMRWNGHENQPLGNPQSRGLPTWFIVPSQFNEAVLKMGGLSPDKVRLARTFLPEK
jgi:hypothetical protein